MEVPRLWRLSKDFLHVVVEKEGKIFMRGRECIWDGEKLSFVDNQIYDPNHEAEVGLMAIGLISQNEKVLN